MSHAVGAGPDRPDERADDPAEQPAAVTWRQRRARLTVLFRRQRIGLLVLAVLLAVAAVIGWGIGRATGPEPGGEARMVVETSLLPLAVDADGIWTSSSDDRDPVSSALVELRRDGETGLVDRNLARWLEAYDAVLLRLAGIDLPDTARPIQRQLIAGVTMSRDAVEVLGHAAEVEDDAARFDLTTEVGRLRQRSEQMVQSARASTSDLGGPRVDVSPLPAITGFEPEGETDLGGDATGD